MAVVLAWQGLLTGQCDLALAGGVSIGVPQRGGYLYQQGGILAPDGHCRAFDRQAAGAVGGNGCAIVVLRRLTDAVADGDTIHAVISGAAINNDGARKVGYTAPSVDGQAEVIRRAHAIAGISVDAIGYVEAHGTGTPLGDPIEVAALTQAFRAGTSRRGYCALGSVKTNVGHLDTAAGVTGLIKAVLAVERGTIPASLHFETPNPALDLEQSPFFVNAVARRWDGERYAGISSFGIGGTNAHVVIRQPRVAALTPSTSTESRPQLVVLSARTASALDETTADLASHLTAHPQVDIADVAYTLQVGRVPQSHRRYLVARDRDGLLSALATAPPARVKPVATPSVAFLLPGQGAQHVRMAAEVYEHEPVFRTALDHAAEVLRPELGLDIRAVIFPADDVDGRQAADTLRLTAIAQPALFAIEHALASQWAAWGVRPDALLGHSVGELVAACLAGTLTVDDGLRMIAERGRLMQGLPPGAMLAVPLPEYEVRTLLGPDCSLAAVNGPEVCVISGPDGAVAAIEAGLSERGISSTRLHTSHAFHSAMMDPVVAPFAAHLRGVRFETPGLPWISNLDGGWIDPDVASDPGYWAGHLRRAVRFADGLTTILEDPDRILLEVGPGQTLTRLARSHPAAAGRTLLASLPAATDRAAADEEHLVGALGRLYQAGVPIDWDGVHHGRHPRRIPLPGIRFQRQRYWIEERTAGLLRASTGGAASVGATGPIRKSGTAGDWTWLPTWRRAAAASVGPRRVETWLILDDGHIGADLVRALQSRGDQVVRVALPDTAGPTGVVDPATRRIDPANPAAIGQLLSDLDHSGLFPTRVVHLWSLSAGRLGFDGLVSLARGLTAAGRTEPLDVAVLTRGVFDVIGTERMRPDAALVLGPARVVPQEHPWIRCRTIDIDDEQGLDGPGVLAELTTAAPEPTVALRSGHRWLPRFDRVSLAQPPVTVLRAGGIYLITGGLGRVGLAAAETIARAVPATLVLVGRSPFPPRDSWPTPDGASNGAPGSPGDPRIQRVLDLERLGSTVSVMQADVADAAQVASLVERVHARFGPLSGVIHAAGATRADAFGPVAGLTSEAVEQHLRPKVIGVQNLAEAVADEPLDFCLLVSSLSSLLGGLRFAGYAAANAYLDAFAIARARTGAPWTSVDWDGWDFAGTAAKGSLALTRAEGMDVFGRLLTGSLPAHLAVSTGDLAARFDQWVRLESLRSTAEPAAATPATAGGAHTNGLARPAGHDRPDLGTDYEAPSDEVEQFIADTWQRLLGIARIGRHDDFFELGGHSLLAVQSASRIRDAFHIDVGVQTLFDAPTVAGLATAVAEALLASATGDELGEILDRVESLSDEEIAALLADT